MRYVILSLFLACAQIIAAQNLVPNSGFETVECPENWQTPGSFGAANWFNPNQSTPDYFGFDTEWGCYGSIFSAAWQDTGEWQFPQEGERMIGLFHYISFTCVREYVGIRLTEPLNTGALYSASMYVALSNNSAACTDCIGMYLSPDSIYEESTCGFDVTGQVQNPAGNLITDTLNWTLIQGDFVAEGGEEFLYIGNVSANDSCMFEVLYGKDVEFASVYYYIDEVKVERKDDVSVNSKNTQELRFFPNPASDRIQVRSFDGSTQAGPLVIMNIYGEVVLENVMWGRETDVSMLPVGMYMVILKTPERTMTSRLVIQR